MSTLERLSDALGIETSYQDAFGTATLVSPATLCALIAVLGEDASDEEAIASSIARVEGRPWKLVLDPVTVEREALWHSVACTLHDAPEASILRWRITEESGVVHDGTCAWSDCEQLGFAQIDSATYVQRAIRIDRSLPLGYHSFDISGNGFFARCALIVVPERAFLSPSLDGERAWGVGAQLYAARRNRDYGIGDFGVLKRLVELVESSGGDFVALNPLHRLHVHNWQAASPYGPTSREFLHPLYIDVESVEEFATCRSAQSRAHSAPFVQRLSELRAATMVQYEAVGRAKTEMLRDLYAEFLRLHVNGKGAATTPRGERFAAFVAEGGDALTRLATYEALAVWMRSRDPAAIGWRAWPNEYADPHGPPVAEFMRDHENEVGYYRYLAWIADEQLLECSRACGEMRIGLYRDLAVGVDTDSAESWGRRDVLRLGATVGAPPDSLNVVGQNWGLPPMDPHALREHAFAPFVTMLRANMRYAGALRIDHVMSLKRLFWIPAGRDASEGAYVRYPFEDMLGILALESVRARCAVVGEDLGTVPEGFRERMERAGVLSCRLLYFERDEDGEYKTPDGYPRLATASIGTHDLPPLAGWWAGIDLEIRERLGVGTDRLPVAREERRLERAAMLRAFGLSEENIDALIDAAYEYIARSTSMLVLVALEDVVAQRDPINVPGTVDEHPNWRRRVSTTVETLRADSRFARLTAKLGDRKQTPRGTTR